jgi:hypothetical protein
MWEPILAFHKSQVMPYFPEVFAGRGYDRISHVLSLRWSAFDFIVADDLFLCHPAERHNYTHGDTTDETWNSQYFANVSILTPKSCSYITSCSASLGFLLLLI